MPGTYGGLAVVDVDKIKVTELLGGLAQNWPELGREISPAVLRLYRAQEYLYADLVAVLRPLGLQPGDFDLLATLRGQPPPFQLSPTVLYRTLFLSSGGLTKVLRRLEHLGFIERETCPTDKRRQFVRLTTHGRELVERAARVTLNHQHRFLAPLTSAERERLDQLLTQLLAPFEGQTPEPSQ